MSKFNAPLKMHFETELLCKAIRKHSEEDSMNIYGAVIYDNIYDVIMNTFPLFTNTYTDMSIDEIVYLFIRNHHSEDPEYFQIAMEFTKFAQNTDYLPINIVKLIEFELAILNVEINLDVSSKKNTME
ncbi:putative DNA-binding domain-containing protein [Photobacterium kishitanii]|uniref:HvfC/BufC family peptide modification chaperone n=1 Tax=Photobacterium kishitanii TaxID=318456 RepID=UPI0007F8CE37|nr:putative DNA-binding domain-containing protein [Photobacterium kishitanii]OBU29692.1 hypothetical protein AYY23_08120 [Photobacterium kishitanii]